MNCQIRIGGLLGLVAVVIVGAAPAFGSFHLMQIEQVIGGVNGDLTAQAIQLRLRQVDQELVSQAKVVVRDAAGLNPVTIVDMTTDVPNAAAGRRVLIASNSFMAQAFPNITPDFFITNPIPPSYLAAGTLTFEDDFDTVYWRLSWGGASYTGTGSVVTVAAGGNDADGNANPPFGGALPSSSTNSLKFPGLAGDLSTNNQAQYALTGPNATFTNNANANSTVIGVIPEGACCQVLTGECNENVTNSACDAITQRYGGDQSTCATMDPPCIPSIGIGLEVVAGTAQTAGPGTLVSPLGVTDTGDGTGRLFIVDQAGQIRVIDSGGNLLPGPMLDVTALMPPLDGGYDERGLLGLAFHPDFEDSGSPGFGKFYVRYSKPRTSTGSEPCDFDPGVCHEEVVARYSMMGDPLTSNVADASSEVIIFRWDKPQGNHNAGDISFGPDGMLYIPTGDGGGAHDGLCDAPPSHGAGGNGQNIESKLGKMIRIDVDGTDGPGGLYGIPTDNPFVGVAGLDEIYAYGFRNPYKFSFDDGPGGDDALYLGDVGQNFYEEVDDVVLGGNYGWAIREGAHCFDPPGACAPLPGCTGPTLIDPINEYSHNVGGISVIGGFVYRGAAYPPLVGKYVYGDFSANFGPTGRLYYFDLTGPEALVRKEFFLVPSGAPFGKYLKGFGRDADGEIYVCASDEIGPMGATGIIYKIVAPPPANIVWGPSKSCNVSLSQSCPGDIACTTDADCDNLEDCTATCKPWPNNNPQATSRSLRFRLEAPAATTATGTPPEVAIKVTPVSLQRPEPRNLPQIPPPNFSTFDTMVNGVCSGGTHPGHRCDADAHCPGGTCGSLAGCTAAGETNGCGRWVGKPGTFLENQDNAAVGNYRAARLQCTPFYFDWVAETNPGGVPRLINVVGAEIAPSSQYSVQTYAASCKGLEDTCTEANLPVTMFTRRSGDVEQSFNPPSTSSQPNAVDVTQLVNKFKNATGALVKAVAQLQPNLPELNADLNAIDIVVVVDALKQFAYPFSGPCPCPSTVTCGATPCATPGVCTTTYGAGSMCVKTCTGGDNLGDPCINNTHCPGGSCSNGFCRDRCGRCSP